MKNISTLISQAHSIDTTVQTYNLNQGKAVILANRAQSIVKWVKKTGEIKGILDQDGNIIEEKDKNSAFVKALVELENCLNKTFVFVQKFDRSKWIFFNRIETLFKTSAYKR